MKYYLKIFGCAANVADSERIAGYYKSRGWTKARSIKGADEVIVVTCMVRQSAQDRITGFVRNLGEEKKKGRKFKIIVTGCLAGMIRRDKKGKLLKEFKKRMPEVDGFLPIEEMGFAHLDSPDRVDAGREYTQLRSDTYHALIPISNGCNNFCSYCVVPFARGREVSRLFKEIIDECKDVAKRGYTEITLVGQNVNSYGSDLIAKLKIKNKISNIHSKYQREKRITYVKHLGRMRIPTLFPHLLEEVCKIDGIKKIDFISSNPWDFSDELIDVIAKNQKINRQIHLPVQSGDDEILKRMNRWYTAQEYLALVKKIRKKIPEVTFSTDIIVGFPGEAEKQFHSTVDLCKKVGFVKAYIAMYSDRPLTYAHENFPDTVPHQTKKRRWGRLEELINKGSLKTKS